MGEMREGHKDAKELKESKTSFCRLRPPLSTVALPPGVRRPDREADYFHILLRLRVYSLFRLYGVMLKH
jgi:hypothetical protein